MNRIGMQPEDRFMVAIGRTLVVITRAGNVFGADIVNNELQPVFQFGGGTKIGFNPEDRFAVSIGNTILIITQNGSVFGCEVTGRELGPVFRYDGPPIGFNPQDHFMVSIDQLIVVITDSGSVFGALVSGQSIGQISQIASGKIGFNPQDRFMVGMGHTLAVITTSGDVFGANVRATQSSVGTTVDGPTLFLNELSPVTQFGGAKIGFNPQDKFMVAMGQTLVVVTNDGNVFGSDVPDNQLGPVFQISDSPPVPLEWFVVDRPDIKFGTGLAVGGHARLTVFSDGTTHFQGHLHTSGFPSFDCLAVFTIKDSDGNAYPAAHGGRVHGTDEPGSRDLDWDEWGTNDGIRANWPKIRSGGQGGSRVDVTSDFSPLKIAEEVAVIVGIVLAVVPLIAMGGGGGSSNKSTDPNYGRPELYPPGGLPPPETSAGNA